MAKAPKTYQRLTRNSAGVASYSNLWLASDHLMIVRSTGFSESYVRVQLRDIKAIFLTETARRVWWAAVWGFIAAWSAVVVFIALVRRETPTISAVFLLLTIGALIWNQLLGPGCRAYIVTGVQTAELPSLVRMKQARAVVLMKLEPLVIAAQADLPAASPSPAIPPVAPPPAREPAPLPPSSPQP